MSKLNAPQILSVLPSFYGTELMVKFSHNITISNEQVKEMVVYIKDLYNNFITTINSKSYSLTNQEAFFTINETLLTIGQYYKIQLAYKDQNDEIGYYSSVGIIKYTSQPTVKIKPLNEGGSNQIQSEFIGVFSSEDFTEKLYSSYYVLTDSSGGLIYQSPEKVHNSAQDTDDEQIEVFKLNQDLSDNEYYKLQFFITTNNGLTDKSFNYEIHKNLNKLNAELGSSIIKAENNRDNGYISVSLNRGNDILSINGQYVLSRIHKETQTRMVLKYFSFNNQTNSNIFLYNDYLIEQGQTYIYILQKFNNKLYSIDVRSNEVVAWFDDIFLYDGKKSLKINFNPTIDSFKTTIMEQKTETMGSKYPFVVRNSLVEYKEFPIGGLISYHSDENLTFFNKQIDKETNLTDSNFLNEREYRIMVLDWLNNGEPKFFKSPSEGSYLIRLMNISLTPETVLGRLLYSFSAQAYEIDEFNETNLLLYNILNHEIQKTDSVKKYVSRSLAGSLNIKDNLIENDDNELGAFEVKIEDAIPGTTFDIYLKGQNGYHTIMIGATGSYSCSNVLIDAIKISQGTTDISKYNKAIIHYAYEFYAKEFEYIEKIEVLPIKAFSLFGWFSAGNENQWFSDLYWLKDNLKYKTLNIKFLQFEKQNLIMLNSDITLTKDNINKYITTVGTLYYQNLKNNIFRIIFKNTDNTITHIISSFDKEVNINNSDLQSIKQEFGDTLVKIANPDVFDVNKIFTAKINETELIDLFDKHKYELTNINLSQLQIGLGLKINICFELLENVYHIESSNETVIEAKNKFQQAPTQSNFEAFLETLKAQGVS